MLKNKDHHEKSVPKNKQKNSARNDLLLAEIEQYHAIVKDFSNQSASIKKLSITIYISFLSLYYGTKIVDMKSGIFILIGLSISVFCYIYEIYIDIVRQKVRIQMQNKIIAYEISNNIQIDRKNGFLVCKLFFIKVLRNRCGLRFYITKKPDCVTGEVFYVNFLHPMYTIYMIEIVATIIIGVIGK